MAALTFRRATQATRALVVLALAATACQRRSVLVVAAEPVTPRMSARDPYWTLTTREHVDLWLHGFARLLPDTFRVTLFDNAYSQRVTAARGAMRTVLDDSSVKLRSFVERDPRLAQAQFVALYFSSWTELSRAVRAFLASSEVSGSGALREYAVLRSYFPTAEGRAFLAMFHAALEDEGRRFFSEYRARELRQRATAFALTERHWRELGPLLDRYLRNSGQLRGTVLASLVLRGQGRTLPQAEGVTVVVGYPRDSASALEPLFTVVREITAAEASRVVAAHATSAERLGSDVESLESVASVRAGAFLLDRIAPDLAAEYRRFYLGLAGASGSSERELRAVYALPGAIADALANRIAIILEGLRRETDR
ncbi:MAG TPA: hypothetical protein VNL96_09740 [Gemmatimonadaceae bacterium]|nr:hypothetical protein [Gemmatimonadaceae bacterium]